jgi:heme o synthase
MYREQGYAKVGIPMLSVTHSSKFTRQIILLYTILLAAVTVLRFVTTMSGLLYLPGAVAWNAGFIA